MPRSTSAIHNFLFSQPAMNMLFCSCVGLFTATIIMSEAFALASTHTVPLLPTFINTGPRIPGSNTAMSLLHRSTVRNNKGAASSSSSSSQRIDSTSTSLNLIHQTIVSTPRGGSGSTSNGNSKLTTLFTAASGSDQTEKCPFSKAMAIFGSVWGSFGVVYILAKAIMRVVPIALEPWQRQSSLVFTPIQWSLYALSCVVFAYAEGYKGFHLKFSPLVVKRSFTLTLGTPQGNNPLNYVLAPLFSMGLFGATKKRMIVSWSVSIGVAVIVALVKQLTPVPRCILDAGVVVGLSIGSCSILYYYFRSMFTGTLPTTDACLPSSSATTKKV